MRFTDLFVRRPVLALVVSTLILLLGLRALSGLPVRQYPLTESTTITVTTEYPGASPDLMQGFVTQPIAQSVATVEGIDYLSSSSTQGRSVITVRMKLNADSNKAMTEVMAKVNEVKYRLPRDAYDPVLVKSSGEATAVAYVGFSSSTLSLAALTDYLSRVVQPQFSSIDGVASVQLYGGQKLAMRVWLDPNRMAARGISAGQLADALRANNVQAAPGQAKGLYVVSNIQVNTDLVNVAEFRDMVVKREGDAIVRLGDVATVSWGGLDRFQRPAGRRARRVLRPERHARRQPAGDRQAAQRAAARHQAEPAARHQCAGAVRAGALHQRVHRRRDSHADGSHHHRGGGDLPVPGLAARC